MNQSRKQALMTEAVFCISMITSLKQSGENPDEYIKKAKKVIRKMRRIDSFLAFQMKNTLKSKIKGS